MVIFSRTPWFSPAAGIFRAFVLVERLIESPNGMFPMTATYFAEFIQQSLFERFAGIAITLQDRS
ncbi:MAG: hypothetical protein ONB42_20445 [candidate division KSB1 bacterium]|nr:hypothetical protein [candidate division KSB1 bacterium]MDZ7313759.1 hypothetical protein [candidate division KSB1 bacterium]